jgi:type I restriction enzyme S subunit
MHYYKDANLLDKHIKGTTIKHLVSTELLSVILPLPPLAEQRRIVAKLEEMFEEIDRLK